MNHEVQELPEGRSFWEENKVMILGIGLVLLVLVCFGLAMLGILWNSAKPESVLTPTYILTPQVPATFTPIPTDTPLPPTATPIPQRAECTTDRGMRRRGGPGTDYPIIGDAAAGTTFEVFGKTSRQGVNWLKVSKDQEDWVSGKYCIPNGAVASVPDIPAPPLPPATPTPFIVVVTATPTWTPECWTQVPNLLNRRIDRDEVRRNLLEPIDDPRCYFEGDHDLEGVVAAQSLAPGVMVACGSRIILTYYTGPPCTPTPEPPTPCPGCNVDDCDIHVVKMGENLFRISQRYNTTVPVLQVLNCLGQKTTIYVGQSLWVPKPSVPVTVTVQPVCNFAVHEQFGSAYDQTEVGCPLAEAEQLWLADQTFEQGRMIWTGSVCAGHIHVLYDDGGWLYRPDEYCAADGDLEYPCPELGAVPPKGPRCGFGAIWCADDTVRAKLGSALEEEWGADRWFQNFEYGMMWTSRDGIIIVKKDETWRLE